MMVLVTHEDGDAHREPADGHREDLRQQEPDADADKALDERHEEHHRRQDDVAAGGRLREQEDHGQGELGRRHPGKSGDQQRASVHEA
jgi:hypothetical protein